MQLAQTNRRLAKRAEAAKQAKKGWGFGGWFGGAAAAAKKDSMEPQPNKPVRAKLGEASSFVYDPELKRWVNKKAGAEAPEAKTSTPPPPRGTPRAVSASPLAPPPPPASAPPMATGVGPMGPPRSDSPLGAGLPKTGSSEALAAPPSMMRSASNTSATGPPSGPPSRPATSLSNSSSIDDLLGGMGPRKPGQKKAKKGARYVDVMNK